jgi:hypothetical protein
MKNWFFKNISYKKVTQCLVLLSIITKIHAADTVTLKYGDAICLSQEADGSTFTLATQTDGSGRVALGAWPPLTRQLSPKFYVQPASATTRWGNGDVVKSGDIIRLEAEYLSKSTTPCWLGYNFNTNQQATLLSQTTNFQVNGQTGVVLKIVKTNTANSDPICSGDKIVFWANIGGAGLTALGVTKTSDGTEGMSIWFFPRKKPVLQTFRQSIVG